MRATPSLATRKRPLSFGRERGGLRTANGIGAAGVKRMPYAFGECQALLTRLAKKSPPGGGLAMARGYQDLPRLTLACARLEFFTASAANSAAARA